LLREDKFHLPYFPLREGLEYVHYLISTFRVMTRENKILVTN